MTLDRRNFFLACSKIGAGATLLPGVLFTLASQAAGESKTALVVTDAMIDDAAKLAGVGPFTAEQKKMLLAGVKGNVEGFEKIRALKLGPNVAPAFVFHPLPALASAITAHKSTPLPALVEDRALLSVPANLEDLAFASLADLSLLIKNKKLSSLDLTKMYLARLKRLDAKLHCVITLTEERALRKAKEADEAIARGEYRGPLHGIPWGAKDLLAVKGYRTTWGAGGFEHQEFDYDATVVERLDAAGAVLIAKLTLGALAMGDKWFGGQTRNPWNTNQGSSGSSAGSASAVAAGCVGFAIGSETMGSISSPSTRCGTSGLRPTFGAVPRTGAMPLSWTMDKLGPICRTTEDCELVFAAIAGPDGKDSSVAAYEFSSFASSDVKNLRIGYIKSAFDLPHPVEEEKPAPNETADDRKAREERNKLANDAHARRLYDRQYEQAALDKLRAMGFGLTPVELPDLPYYAMGALLSAEAAAAFDELTRSGRDALLTEQTADDWPTVFRTWRFYPAVEYIQANRARSLLIDEMRKLFETIDVIVVPSVDGKQLAATNLSGHPALILPNGLRGADAPHAASFDDGNSDDIAGPNTPVSITFLGRLYHDAELLALGRAYQSATDHHKNHPTVE